MGSSSQLWSWARRATLTITRTTLIDGPRFDGTLDARPDLFVQRRHGSGLRRHPATPAVACLIQRREVGAPQHVSRHGGSKRIAGANGIGDLHGNAGMIVAGFTRDQKAAASAA